MKTKNFFLKVTLSCCLTLFMAMSSFAQCVNTSSFGSANAINDGDPHVISGCNYLGEHSGFSNATIGDDYEFTLEGGGYITVTDTSFGVLAHGAAPLVWTATTNDVRLHWNGNAGCSTDSSCHDTGYTNLSIVPPAAPENDLCADALGLECGSVKTGTNINGTDTGEVSGFCGTSVSGAGVWYKFEGNGSDVVVSTCSANTDYDTKLNVYEGECGSLVCVGGDDDDSSSPQCSHSLRHSLVEFSSELGAIYYIYVSGFIGDEGNFDLTLTCKVQVDIAESCATVYDGYAPLACADITAASTFGTPPYTYSWSNGDTGETINVCPTVTTTYEVTVTDAAGDTDTAETTVVATNVSCGNNGDKVEICHVSGNGSTNTICVSANAVQAHLDHGDSLGACEDTYTCDTAPSCASVLSPEAGSIDQSTSSEITWSAGEGLVESYTVSIGTTLGGTDVADNVDVGENLSYTPGSLDYLTTYYVSVTANNANGSAEGCAGSSFTTEESPWCSADALECGSVKSGSTVGLDAGSGLETCGTSLNDVPGQWYSFIGTGDTLSITTCSPNTDFDTKLGVFTGSCTSISCVAGDDDEFSCPDSTLHSLVEFISVPGETYYIFITGFNSFSNGPQTGNYDLTITCLAPPADAPSAENTVDCSSGTTSYSYCYNNNDSSGWAFTSNDGSSVSVTFNSGTIEGNFDYVRIYDGADNTGTLLFESSSSFGTIDLAGASGVSSGDSLFVEVDSDSSVSCQSGSRDTWNFDVSCAQARSANEISINDELSWTMYPNPTKGYIQLDLSQLNVVSAQVEVYDYTGKILRNLSVNTKASSQVDMDLQGLASGVYFVKVISNNGTSVKQLMIR